jgi:hypothetical protein
MRTWQIAPGMKVKFDVVIAGTLPSASMESHQIRSQIDITTEWEILHLPIQASTIV